MHVVSLEQRCSNRAAQGSASLPRFACCAAPFHHQVAGAHTSTRGGTRESSAGDGMGIKPGCAEACPAYHGDVLAALGMHGLSSSLAVFDTIAKVSLSLGGQGGRIAQWVPHRQKPGALDGLRPDI
jgi:hypothetical protein